jgi:predicted DNA-binding protein with PD1-like motif
MKTKLLHEHDGQRTFAVVLESGDEVCESLLAFAREHAIGGAGLSAIGAFCRVTLAYFDWERGEYLPIPVDEQVEVLSLTGDIAIGDNGKPRLHLHVAIGKRDGSAWGGHLLRAEVRPTLEVILTESPPRLRRRSDPATGLALIDLERA